MLKTLINSSQSNSFTLIEDSADVSSKFLLREFIEASKSHSQKTLVLCFEKRSKLLRRELNLDDSLATFIDCYHNYHDSSVTYEMSLSSIIEPHVSLDDKITVIIDSFTPLFYNKGLQNTYRDIHQLLTKPIKKGVELVQLVMVSHTDTLPDVKNVSALSHLATNEILLVPSNIVNKYRVFIKQAKKTGKIIKQEEYCWYDKDKILISEEMKTVSKVEETVDPNDLTTFKLRLEVTELKARSELKLPYVKTSEAGDAGGQIFYTPDENDDWDEEDPDDDLDI